MSYRASGSPHICIEITWLLIWEARGSLTLPNSISLHYLGGCMPKVLSLTCHSLKSALLYLVISFKKWIPIPPTAQHFQSLTSYSDPVHPLFLPGGLDLACVPMGEGGQSSRISILPISQFSRAQTTWPQSPTCLVTPQILHIEILTIPCQRGRGIPSCGSSLAMEGK